MEEANITCKVRARQLNFRAQGLCEICGKPSEGKCLCESCRAKQKARKSLKTKKGICRDCSEKRLKGLVFCEKHHLSRIARNRLGNKTKWPILKAILVKQNNKCALTGDPIDYSNMELDHIHPKSKGGSNESSNLRWVLKEVNRAKGVMTDDELKLLCYKILRGPQ
jgi:5-methylcytosine-specific restriction endonuclease McrA